MDEKSAETLRKSRELVASVKKQQELYKTMAETQKTLAESGYLTVHKSGYGGYGDWRHRSISYGHGFGD